MPSPRFVVLAIAPALVAAGVLLTGCASAGAGSADITPTPPPVPVKKPFQAPSYDATEFHHEASPAFKVQYPADFEEQPSQGGVLTAASPAMAPRVDVSVQPVSGAMSLEAVTAQITALFAQIGGGEAKVTAAKETTLQDGVTPAMEFVVDWEFQGAFPLQSLVLVSSSDGKSAVNVSVTNMAGMDLEPLREIAYTLYFD